MYRFSIHVQEGERKEKYTFFLVKITNCLEFCKILSKLSHLFLISILWGDYSYPYFMHEEKCGFKKFKRKGQNPSMYLLIQSQSITFYLIFGTVLDEHYFSESITLCLQKSSLDLGIFSV